MTPCRRSEQHASTTGETDRSDHWSVNAGYLSSFLALVNAGYLSSFLALETAVGLQSCPWLVDVPPGRQVNITVLSFSESWPGRRVTSDCEWTVVVREENVTTHLPGCAGDDARGGRRRQRVIYTSHRRGTPLAVYLRPTAIPSTLRFHFLLYFQGKLSAGYTIFSLTMQNIQFI